METEQAVKIIQLQEEHSRLLGQIEAYNTTLSKVEEARELFKGLLEETEDKGVFAGITLVENKVINECQHTIKKIKQVRQEIDRINGIEYDDTVTDFEEWIMLNS